jgi:NitT/TauT family transport system ATP-binding protein
LSKLELKNIRKEFDLGTSGKFLLFEDLSFEFADEEKFLAVLSPFGSGKTTLLNIIAGLEPPTRGEVLLNGKNYTYPDGQIVLIPEKPSSFPWLSVKENISLISRKTNTDEIINITGLEGYENHYPDNQSSGFRFRIAIGRAVSLNPAFILLDNSLKMVDHLTRIELFEMLKNIAEKMGIKFLMATTNISEAVQLGDRVLVMKNKPSSVAGEFRITERDKNSLIQFIKDIEDIFQQSDSSRSINFTI